MRISWYGFGGFCQEFLELHLDHYIVPLRANGSAIKTVFSQQKHSSCGTLKAISYGALLVTKQAVHGPHVRDDYRNVPFYIQESELSRLKRPRKSWYKRTSNPPISNSNTRHMNVNANVCDIKCINFR